MSAHSSRGARWNKLRRAVLERDNWTCAYCGKPLADNADATADHITPKSNGGEDELWNLVAACRTCNGRRQDRALIRQNYINTKWLSAL